MPETRYPEFERVAVAVLHGEPPTVFIAQNEAVLARVLSLQVVARSLPAELAPSGRLDEIRHALLDERWADALFAWMDVTDSVIDVYPDDWVWTDSQLDQEAATFEIRMAKIFSEG